MGTAYPRVMDSVPRCARHPDVETRLRCVGCDTPICPTCGREAAVGFKCPDCAAHAEGTVTRRDQGGLLGRFGFGASAQESTSERDRSAASDPGGQDAGGHLPEAKEPDATDSDRDAEQDQRGPSRDWGSAGGQGGGAQLPVSVGARATAVGVAAAVVGGLILGPVLHGGMLFLLSAGVIGWGVARAVYWATDERNSPYVRTLALVAAGATVAVGIGFASTMMGGRATEIALLAYPAALYGGWIVVRQR